MWLRQLNGIRTLIEDDPILKSLGEKLAFEDFGGASNPNLPTLLQH